MTRFTTSPLDQRRLSCLPHRIANMPPSRREQIFGKVQPMDAPRSDAFQRLVAWVAMGLVVVAFLAWGVN